jgi:hypothetical protein
MIDVKQSDYALLCAGLSAIDAHRLVQKDALQMQSDRSFAATVCVKHSDLPESSQDFVLSGPAK